MPTQPVRILIRKLPPSHLEGFDLRNHKFREGQIYEVGRHLGEVLIVCGYAEPEMSGKGPAPAADKKRRD